MAMSSRPARRSTSGTPSGSVTRAKGYKAGGAIINGRTEPQGALAGGICSCSTTLFNAVLRGGYEMGARRNHYYYIDRYPLGLDATVFISASGSKQTVSFTNDTDYPILLRGYGYRDGSAGYVKFEVYSVPTRSQGLVQQADRPQRPPRDRYGPVHLEPGARSPGAHRVPGRWQAGDRHPDRPRSQRQRGPPGHVLLQLRADHRYHARRPLTRQSAGPPRRRSRSRIAHPGPDAVDGPGAAVADRPRRPWAMASASVALTPNRRSA